MIKKIYALLPILVLIGIFSVYVFTENRRALLSPFAGFWDDGTSQISEKISSPLNLDFATSTELSSLENIPRYLVYNSQNGHVYHAKASSEFMSPASFSKLLSSQVALDLIPINAQITATAESVDKIPTILGIKAGEKFTAEELLRGAIATSANDAAQTLSDGAALANNFDQKDFLRLMNKKAMLMGMKSSQFATVDGLDSDKQFSTLEDIAQLIHNVQQNYPEIASAAASDREDIENTAEHGRYYLPNWNGLLGVYPGVDGLKIAYTEKAGYSTIVTATIKDHHFVAIVSGADSYLERDRAAADLLDAALIAEKESPKKINRWSINKRYQEWGDLARQIKDELEAIEKADNVNP